MKNEEMARLFSEATPYIQKYHGRTMAIKYGGNAMINEELKDAVMHDVDEEQVRGQGRKRDLMEARQTAMYLIRRMTNLSLNDIGKEFGDRDHTTVLHSLDQVEKKMRSDPAYAEKVKEITTNINNKK